MQQKTVLFCCKDSWIIEKKERKKSYVTCNVKIAPYFSCDNDTNQGSPIKIVDPKNYNLTISKNQEWNIYNLLLPQQIHGLLLKCVPLEDIYQNFWQKSIYRYLSVCALGFSDITFLAQFFNSNKEGLLLKNIELTFVILGQIIVNNRCQPWTLGHQGHESMVTLI